MSIRVFLCKNIKRFQRQNSILLETRGPGALYRAQEYHCNLVLFSFKYMKREKGRDLTPYTNLCGLNTLPH